MDSKTRNAEHSITARLHTLFQVTIYIMIMYSKISLCVLQRALKKFKVSTTHNGNNRLSGMCPREMLDSGCSILSFVNMW